MNKESARQMMQLITAQWITTPLTIVVNLGIPDILEPGPMGIDDLTRTTKTHGPTLYRIMRALAGVGIFEETGDREFKHTPLSGCLQSDAMGPAARMFLSEWHSRAWDALSESVFTGEVPFHLAHNTPAYDWLREHPEAAAHFHRANAGKAAASYPAILKTYDFSPFDSFTDIGGGYGILASELLHHYPHIKGTIADLPAVLEKTRKHLDPVLRDNRCSLVPCDFFREIPRGSDLYIMANILHNWDDTKCGTILENCRRAMEPGTPLLLIEMIISPGNTPSTSKFMDLEVFVMGGGKERKVTEFRDLLTKAGLQVHQVIGPEREYTILECVRGDS